MRGKARIYGAISSSQSNSTYLSLTIVINWFQHRSSFLWFGTLFDYANMEGVNLPHSIIHLTFQSSSIAAASAAGAIAGFIQLDLLCLDFSLFSLITRYKLFQVLQLSGVLCISSGFQKQDK
ncbi:hypothetical protein CDAR_212431 [Caerostris darwini]|uniref:Uncharacterized protein n=1 Tax=Caerostris darwini TaxID=1538125 RepID=A0AAV4MG25_9ARAC|nr:hypothetical protein CDAR_212431 [Caerostris darwini]